MNTPRDIVDKLTDHLAASGWNKILRVYLMGQSMETIVEQLEDSSKLHGRWIPSMRECIRWLTQCPVEQVKVVIVSDVRQNLYKKHTGIPLSGRGGSSVHPILEKMLMAIDPNIVHDTDTTRWSKQGVLQIPLSPTWTIGGNGHHKIWGTLTAQMISKVNELWPEAPIILMGANTHHLRSRFIGEHVYKVKVVYGGIEPVDVFQRVNEVLKQQNKSEIRW